MPTLRQDPAGMRKRLLTNNSSELGKAKNKTVELTLLIHPHPQAARSTTSGVANTAAARPIRLKRPSVGTTPVLPHYACSKCADRCLNRLLVRKRHVTFFTNQKGGTIPEAINLRLCASMEPRTTFSKRSGRPAKRGRWHHTPVQATTRAMALAEMKSSLHSLRARGIGKQCSVNGTPRKTFRLERITGRLVNCLTGS